MSARFDGRVWWVLTAIPADTEIDGVVGWMPVFRDSVLAYKYAEKERLPVVAGRVAEGTIDG